VCSDSDQAPARFSTVCILPAQTPLRGRIRLPGDKSVSIRRALLTLFSDDEAALDNFGSGEDCLTALYCLEQLGKTVERESNRVIIGGKFHRQQATLDCRNSGTAARLLMGILSGFEGEWILTGDSSLSSRPMERIAAPLREMGAIIKLSDGRLPAKILGGKLRSIRYESAVASAQLKSAVLLAGLGGGVEVQYREPFFSRTHTERLLELETDSKGWIQLDQNAEAPSSAALSGGISGDPSSATFWGVAAALIPDSELILEGVLTDPVRCGWIDVLQASGVDIRVENESQVCSESVGDVVCKSSSLTPIKISQEMIPRVIDEIPILSIAATQARGCSRMRRLAELRVKESDRLAQIEKHLSGMNATVEIGQDELSIAGPVELCGAVINPERDHRIAMAFAIAGLIAKGNTKIHQAECAAVSYQEFWKDLSELSPGSLQYEN